MRVTHFENYCLFLAAKRLCDLGDGMSEICKTGMHKYSIRYSLFGRYLAIFAIRHYSVFEENLLPTKIVAEYH